MRRIRILLADDHTVVRCGECGATAQERVINNAPRLVWFRIFASENAGFGFNPGG
jgi:hypothetical protein